MWRDALKSLWRLSRGAVFVGRFGGPLMLSFHRVVSGAGERHLFLDRRIGAVSPAFLRDVLELLSRSGYQFVSLGDWATRRAEQKRIAAITFDDGFRDVLDLAAPILRSHRCPGTAFLITATLGATELLWQHRIYIAWDRMTEGARTRLLFSFLDRTALGPTTDSRLLLSELLRIGMVEQLEEFSRALGRSTGLTPREERRLASQLYLKLPDVRHLQDAGVAVGGHGHKHLRASAQHPEDLLLDLKRCWNVLSSLSVESWMDFGIPHGDLGNNIADRARDVGFRHVLDSRGVATESTPDLAHRVWLWDDLNDAHAILTMLWGRQLITSVRAVARTRLRI